MVQAGACKVFHFVFSVSKLTAFQPCRPPSCPFLPFLHRHCPDNSNIMASRSVLVLRDLFIPDRAIVRSPTLCNGWPG